MAESVITSDDGWGARRVIVVNNSNNDGAVTISFYDEKGLKIGNTKRVDCGYKDHWDVPANTGRYTIRAKAAEAEAYTLFKVIDSGMFPL